MSVKGSWIRVRDKKAWGENYDQIKWGYGERRFMKNFLAGAMVVLVSVIGVLTFNAPLMSGVKIDWWDENQIIVVIFWRQNNILGLINTRRTSFAIPKILFQEALSDSMDSRKEQSASEKTN